jgi:hypothetical protein
MILINETLVFTADETKRLSRLLGDSVQSKMSVKDYNNRLMQNIRSLERDSTKEALELAQDFRRKLIVQTYGGGFRLAGDPDQMHLDLRQSA